MQSLCSAGDQQGRLQLVAGEEMGQYRHRPCWADPFTGTSGVEDHLCCHRASQARTRWFVWFLSLWCVFFHVNLEWQLHCSCGNLVVSAFISLTVVGCWCQMFRPDMTYKVDWALKTIDQLNNVCNKEDCGKTEAHSVKFLTLFCLALLIACKVLTASFVFIAGQNFNYSCIFRYLAWWHYAYSLNGMKR